MTTMGKDINSNAEAEIDQSHLKTLKRRAYAKFTSAQKVRDSIRDLAYLNIPYHEDTFRAMEIEANGPEEREAVEILHKRYHAASLLELVLEKKSRLKRLEKEKQDKGSALLPNQQKALTQLDKEVAELSDSFSSLPPIGYSYEEWAKEKRPSGRQRRQPEQDLIRFKWDFDASIHELNRYEKKFDLKTSTASSLEAERDNFSRRAGRNPLPANVAGVENIDRSLRRAEEEHQRTLARPESEFEPKKFGKDPMPKSERLALQEKEIEQLRKQLKKAESQLEGTDLLERHKKVVERAKRAAKDAGKEKEYQKQSKLYTKLKAAESAVADIVAAGADSNAINAYVTNALSSISKKSEAQLKDVSGFIEDSAENEVVEAASSVKDAVSNNEDEIANSDNLDDILDSVLSKY